MTQMLAAAALAATAAAVVLGASTLVATRDPRTALPVLLDLLLVAGLLRLPAATGWTAIGTAAGVVAVRHLVVAGLRARPPHDRSAPPDGGPGVLGRAVPPGVRRRRVTRRGGVSMFALGSTRR